MIKLLSNREQTLVGSKIQKCEFLTFKLAAALLVLAEFSLSPSVITSNTCGMLSLTPQDEQNKSVSARLSALSVFVLAAVN